MPDVRSRGDAGLALSRVATWAAPRVRLAAQPGLAGASPWSWPRCRRRAAGGVPRRAHGSPAGRAHAAAAAAHRLVASLGQITLRASRSSPRWACSSSSLSRLALDLAPNTPAGDRRRPAAGPNGQDPAATVLTWLPIIAVAAIVIVLLVRRWLRRRPIAAAVGVAEQRWTRTGGGRRILGGLRWPWRSRSRAHVPTNAIEAYLAALDDLGARRTWHVPPPRRRPRTPTACATRASARSRSSCSPRTTSSRDSGPNRLTPAEPSRGGPLATFAGRPGAARADRCS